MVDIKRVYEIALLKIKRGVFNSLVPLKHKNVQVYLIAFLGVFNSLDRAIIYTCFQAEQKHAYCSSMLLMWPYELQGKAVSENEYYVN